MKFHQIASVLGLAALLGACGDSDSSSSSSSSYVGTYQCTFNGSDNGTVNFKITTVPGSASNCTAYSNVYRQTWNCGGSITSTGNFDVAFASTGATANMQANSTGASGTWRNTGVSGNISCTRS